MTSDTEARSGVYHLLARLWLREVDQQFLTQLQTSPLQESFESAGGTLPIGNDADDEVKLETLAIDYCRLFIGPKDHLPPIQSVWQTGQFQGSSAASVTEFMEAVRYNVELPQGLMADHFGVQLDLMGYIVSIVSSAPNWSEISDLPTRFFNQHLLWSAPLLTAAKARAETDFYRSVISMTNEFLQAESELSTQK